MLSLQKRSSFIHFKVAPMDLSPTARWFQTRRGISMAQPSVVGVPAWARSSSYRQMATADGSRLFYIASPEEQTDNCQWQASFLTAKGICLEPPWGQIQALAPRN